MVRSQKSERRPFLRAVGLGTGDTERLGDQFGALADGNLETLGGDDPMLCAAVGPCQQRVSRFSAM
jgi:hypothetical protein